MNCVSQPSVILLDVLLTAGWLCCNALCPHRWEYCHEPAAGTPEADFMDAARHARNWV